MMIVQVFAPIAERIMVKIQAMLSQSLGWVLSVGVFLMNFIAPVKYSFIIMVAAVGMDLLFSMISVKKQGKFFLSQIMRDTPVKLIIYGGCMLVVYMMERNFGDDATLMTKAGCTLACACELWSMLGSAIIICPNMPFPRLLKLQLKGEIEAKLGKNVSNLLDKEDKKNDKSSQGNPEQ